MSGKIQIHCTREEAERYSRLWQFAAGYTLPDDVTLSDVLHVFENAIQCFGDDEGEPARDMVADMRDTLAKFKKED